MLFLAYDIGTSGVKSSLVNELGEIVSHASYEYRWEKGTETEQDPDLWWQGVCTTTDKLLSQDSTLTKKIEAIGVGGHMLGCLPVNSLGEPLRPAMLHSDTRATAEEKCIAETIGRDTMYRKTGNTLGPQSSLAKILWLKNNEPEVYTGTSKFLQSKDYITSKLTGYIDTCDHSDGAHSQLMNIHTKEPLLDIFNELGVDNEKIPSFKRGTDIAGKLADGPAKLLGLLSGIPVITGGGDGACANAGAGIKRGQMYCSLGTTAWLSSSSGEAVLDSRARIFNIPSLDGEDIGVFGTMQAAGRCVEWAKDLFKIADLKEFDTTASSVPEGSAGLIFLPYLEGERSPIFDSNARGVYFRIDVKHERPHFLRATLEGVTYGLRSILEVFREHMPVEDIQVIGGGGNSALWRQMMADIFKVSTWSSTVKSGSITSRGVGLAAAVGIGVYKNLAEAESALVPHKTSNPRSAASGIYDEQFCTFLKLYQHTKNLF